MGGSFGPTSVLPCPSPTFPTAARCARRPRGRCCSCHTREGGDGCERCCRNWKHLHVHERHARHVPVGHRCEVQESLSTGSRQDERSRTHDQDQAPWRTRSRCWPRWRWRSAPRSRTTDRSLDRGTVPPVVPRRGHRCVRGRRKVGTMDGNLPRERFRRPSSADRNIMKPVLATFILAVAIGLLAGGRFSGLSHRAPALDAARDRRASRCSSSAARATGRSCC